jgi:hypothetical protein
VPFKVIPVVKELGRTRMEANVSVRSLFGTKLFALNTQVWHAAAVRAVGAAACSPCHYCHILRLSTIKLCACVRSDYPF